MVIEISSNSDSDSDDDNSSNNDSELEKSIIDQKQIRYFKPDQISLYEPSSIKYKQESMRSNYNKWVETGSDYIVETVFNFTDGISRDAKAYLVTI